MTIEMKSLTWELANRVAVAAIQNCTDKGFKVAVAVVGRNGDLLAFLRHPLAGPHTVATSQRKAYTAASMQVLTGQFQRRRSDLNFAPGILLIQGGVPLGIGGVHYGGVAVSGAEPEMDEQCARHGIDAVAEEVLLGE